MTSALQTIINNDIKLRAQDCCGGLRINRIQSLGIGIISNHYKERLLNINDLELIKGCWCITEDWKWLFSSVVWRLAPINSEKSESCNTSRRHHVVFNVHALNQPERRSNVHAQWTQKFRKPWKMFAAYRRGALERGTALLINPGFYPLYFEDISQTLPVKLSSALSDSDHLSLWAILHQS